MKLQLIKLLEQAVEAAQIDGFLTEKDLPTIGIERTRDRSHGDFASNIAMLMSKTAKSNPCELASQIIAALPDSDLIAKTEIAGPGFINFYLAAGAYHAVLTDVLATADKYGCSNVGQGKKIHMEYVSANPTGPLHVGHGRGAAYGATLYNLLSTAGYDIHREYYVNDAGRQMNILAISVWLRYLDLCGEKVPFPVNAYQGDYIWDIAASLNREHGKKFHKSIEQVFDDIPADEPAGGDKEGHIDALIERVKALLGEQNYDQVFNQGLKEILGNIRADLTEFGVEYDEWFSERSLMDSNALDHGVQRLRETGYLYEKDGATWFKSSEFGDEKDRVVIRENGQPTYFASDIAYHVNKLERGYDQIINIWGADHHGYVPRIKAVLKAMNEAADKLEVLLVQFAVLYRGGKKLQMSTRSGEFVTLRELRHEVGNDAARFYYAMRKSEQHMDFDLDLAKSQSNDNPVYYVQYAHARICSVYRQLKEKGLSYDKESGIRNLVKLTEKQEQDLMVAISRYPEVLEAAALNHDPHDVVHYVRQLANYFHSYYNAHVFLSDKEDIRNARLVLISATRQVIHNALSLLGVSAPESM